MASSRAASCVAPADYGALFEQYHDVVRRVVWRQLGPHARREDAEDGTSYVFLRLQVTDILAQYKPGTISGYTGTAVTFQAFLMRKVALYCRGLRETLNRRAGRELLLLDAPVGDSGQDCLADMYGTCDEYPSLVGEGINLLREGLLAREGAPGRAPVVPLFDELAARFTGGQSISMASVRRVFGLDAEGIAIWFGELRDALREVTGRRPPVALAVPEGAAPVAEELPPAAEIAAWFGELRKAAGLPPRPEPEAEPAPEPEFELGGLVLTAQEVREAASTLRAAAGNRVQPVWARAGHRLAAAGTRWYLAFAEEVMKCHPELRTAPKRHSEGHFGRVKQALVYGLEELTAGLSPPDPALPPEPAPVPVDPLWLAFEEAARALPGVQPEQVDDILTAVRLLVPT